MSLDQFYTKQCIAEKCFKIVDTSECDVLLEPSAGTGSFYNLMDTDKRVGLDVEPKCKGVIKMNFFDYVPETNKRYCVIGNPPFGRVSSIAIKFFNKCAEFSDTIAFIIPRTFMKTSVQNRLDLNFNLIYNEILPPGKDCFEPSMNAKCCFQIWRRIKDGKKREKIVLKKNHPYFMFVKHGPKDDKGQPTPPSDCDFAIRAYGGKCGEIRTKDLSSLRPKSWHWISVNTELISKDELIDMFNKLDYSDSLNTVRQNSIGQQELVKLFEDGI